MNRLLAPGGKKEALLRASIGLFAAKGYDGVSVRDIARAAGVSEAALYKHFAGKEDLARHVFGVIAADYAGRLRCAVRETGGAVDKLCRIVAITYELYRENPAAIRFVFLSQYYFWDCVSDEDKPHLIVRQILEEGMAAGEIPHQEAFFWLTVYSGLLLQPLAQYPYFQDRLPDYAALTAKVQLLVRKLFS